VLELEDADHGLGSGGDPRALPANLVRVIDAVDAFAAPLG